MEKFKIFSRLTIIFFFCIFIVFSQTSCISIIRATGSGNITTQDRAVSGVDSITVSAGMNLYLEQADSEKLTIEAEENILPLVVTHISDGNLVIRYERIIFGSIIARKPVNIYLAVKDIDKINLSSGAKLESELLKTDSLALDLSSGSSGKISAEIRDLACNLSSGANLAISGKAVSQDIRLSSGASYEAKELVCDHAKVNISSGSSATINVIESLDATVSSGATVRYAGQPQISSNITSGGSLQNINKN